MITALLLAVRRLCRRLHIAWLRTRHTQLQVAAIQLLRDPAPGTGPHLAVLLARAAAVRCQIVALEMES